MGIHRDGLKDESLSDERRNTILEQAMPWKFKRPKVLTLDLIHFCYLDDFIIIS